MATRSACGNTFSFVLLAVAVPMVPCPPPVYRTVNRWVTTRLALSNDECLGQEGYTRARGPGQGVGRRDVRAPTSAGARAPAPRTVESRGIAAAPALTPLRVSKKRA